MAMSVAKEAFEFDLPAVCKELRAAAKRVALETGTRPMTVPPPMTVGWVLIAMLDDTSGDGHKCYGSPAYFINKTGVSLATLYRVLDLFEAVGAYEQVPAATGRTEHRWHLEKLPRKAPWISPKRGRPRTNAQVKKASQVAKKPSQVEKKPSQVEKKPSQVASFVSPLWLPEVEPISDATRGSLRSDPLYDPGSDPGSDPIVAGRIFDSASLWIRVRDTILKKQGWSTAMWDNWIDPLRLYHHEDGTYYLTGKTGAQVDRARKMASVFRYAIGQAAGEAAVELRIVHHTDLEHAASHGEGTSLVYPPAAVGS